MWIEEYGRYGFGSSIIAAEAIDTTAMITNTRSKRKKSSYVKGERRQNKQKRQEEEQQREQQESDYKPLIVGGNDAPRGRYPYIVLLVDRNQNPQCSATLISPTIVLTAAHCQMYVLMANI